MDIIAYKDQRENVHIIDTLFQDIKLNSLYTRLASSNKHSSYRVRTVVQTEPFHRCRCPSKYRIRPN